MLKNFLKKTKKKTEHFLAVSEAPGKPRRHPSSWYENYCFAASWIKQNKIWRPPTILTRYSLDYIRKQRTTRNSLTQNLGLQTFDFWSESFLYHWTLSLSPIWSHQRFFQIWKITILIFKSESSCRSDTQILGGLLWSNILVIIMLHWLILTV